MNIPVSFIEQSFELAAARCDDLTPLVYRRLFADHPETDAMFRREPNDLVKDSMLAHSIDALIDYAGERSGAFRMIACEVMSHDAYGTPPELFVRFFHVIASSLREVIGDQWSPPIAQAWQELLSDLDRLVDANDVMPAAAPA